MKDVIRILLADATLHALIGDNIYPNHTTYLGDCIVYTYNTVYNDKAVKRQRLKLTIIATDLETVDAIEACVSALLLTLGDDILTNDVVQVKQNGGGDLFDTSRNKNHRILYYDLTMRS